MATNETTMAPSATRDTARTATVPGQQEPVVQEKRGMFSNKHTNKSMAAGGMSGPDGPYGHKFKFGQWIKLHLLDLLTMAAMGAIGLGVYEADPAPTRNFPIYNNNSEVVYPQFAYPYRKNIIPIYAAALIAFFVPFVFFVLFQIRHRSPEMLLGSTMGLLEGLITAAVFQVFNKWLIGGLRPHFLDVCKPDFSRQTGMGFEGYMYTREVCTGDANDINDSLESWMSGHSTAAFAGLIYLFFYFNAQLKVMSDHRGAYWKYVLTIAPVCGAVLIAASLTVDEYHNWYDCVGGALTGTFCAFIAYRKTFAAIWDFRFNHVLLPRSTSLFHRHASEGAFSKFGYSVQESMLHRPFTHEGGWRDHEAFAGAPSDALGSRQSDAGLLGSGGHIGAGYSPGQYTNKPAQGAMMV
ncbi:hypothetical protein NliqN6_1297 [Naganishia liquefaciens]|uniref:Phosphatidic acid phosphatase type 2/haloperoxidase domain-containing protein n=1 Tax=Naganishia liquefaciens TaxID=104408 RepID=A0A8H3YD09_9TREE|nr:hypothetical protein NliqN6_1297 [Naganishia liquefaciens]